MVGQGPPDNPEGMQPWLAYCVVLAAGTIVLGTATVRVVPAGHRGVVVRAGRPRREAGEGLVAVVPVLDRVTMVSLHPATIDPVVVPAITHDGAEVRVVLSVLWQVTEPTAASGAEPGAGSVTALVVERAVRREAAHADLGRLLRDQAALVRLTPEDETLLHEHAGVRVLDIAIVDTEVRASPELLRLLA